MRTTRAQPRSPRRTTTASRRTPTSRCGAWSASTTGSSATTTLNQITGQVNSLKRLSDTVSVITGEHFMRDYPNVPLFPLRLAFPAVNTGAGGQAGSITDTQMMQLKDEVSLQTGTHAVKFGVNYNYLKDIGLLNGNAFYGVLTFFDDPSVILTNRTRYPQGFQTPGIVRQWEQGESRPGGFPPRRASDRHVVPGRLARDAAPDVEPRGPLRHRRELLSSVCEREQRDAAGAGGDRQPVRRRAQDAVRQRVAALRHRLRPVGGWAAGAARRRRHLLRPVQHQRRQRLGHLLAEQAAAERPRHLDEHRRSASASCRRSASGSIRSRQGRHGPTRCRSAHGASGSPATSSIPARIRGTSATRISSRTTPAFPSITHTSRGATSSGR